VPHPPDANRSDAETEGLFRALIEDSNDVFLVLDARAILRLVGGPTLRVLGYEPQEMVGRSGFDFVEPDDLAVVGAVFAEAVVIPGARRRFEYRCRHKDGHAVHVETVGTNRLDDPRMRAVVLNVRDITQRRRAEADLREAREQRDESAVRSKNIIESSPMGIHSYVLDPQRGLVLVGANQAADRILGIDHRPLIGRTIEEAFAPLAETEIPARYRDVAVNGIPWTTSQIDYSDGVIRGAFEVFAFQTTQDAMAVFFLDITARLRAEEDGKRLAAQLAQAQRLESVGRLAGGVAHDFNNLLTSITGNVGLALMDLEPNHPVCQMLEDVRRAAESAASLTRQLLAFSRRQVAERRVLNLADTVEHALRMLRRVIGENVHLQFDPRCPEANLMADPSQIEQVLVNLAVNASDSMPAGGRVLIETDAIVLDDEYCAHHAEARPGAYVVLTVSDAGSGMTGGVMAHIFEPFFSTKAIGKGTGLGLATVFGIVKQNGGSIQVYSEVGVGSTFKVYLPRVDAAPPPPPSTVPPEMPGGTETVVLVEDADDVRALAVRVLSRLGYSVCAYPDGERALAAFESISAPVALLVTDVVLPGMNGRVLADAMQKLRPNLKVLYCSGYTKNVVAHHGILEEGLAFLGKPYSPRSLAQKVRAVLDRP
jgi:two-component system, cell cycle sensor histidine kinase and response regulator CckA